MAVDNELIEIALKARSKLRELSSSNLTESFNECFRVEMLNGPFD
jgi:hypothetical protein